MVGLLPSQPIGVLGVWAAHTNGVERDDHQARAAILFHRVAPGWYCGPSGTALFRTSSQSQRPAVIALQLYFYNATLEPQTLNYVHFVPACVAPELVSLVCK